MHNLLDSVFVDLYPFPNRPLRSGELLQWDPTDREADEDPLPDVGPDADLRRRAAVGPGRRSSHPGPERRGGGL